MELDTAINLLKLNWKLNKDNMVRIIFSKAKIFAGLIVRKRNYTNLKLGFTEQME